MRFMIISLVDNTSGEIIHSTLPHQFEKVDTQRDCVRRNVGSFLRYLDLYPWQNVTLQIDVVDDVKNPSYKTHTERLVEQLELF